MCLFIATTSRWFVAPGVRICDLDDGFSFAVLGVVPERRLMLESIYGALTMKNGVPIGYVLFSSLFESTEVAFNVFDTFRGAEAAHVLSRVLAVGHRLFGARTFSIDPYQLGHFGNHEGLASGAWWFYYKLGFRPRDRGVLRLAALELRKMNQNRKHRSSLATLEDLSAAPMFFSLDGTHGISRQRSRPAAPASRLRAFLRNGTAPHGSAELQSPHARRRRFAAFGRSPHGAPTSDRRGSAGARCSSLCQASRHGARASAARLARSRARRGERGKLTITESSTRTPNFDAGFSAC
jgi:hypothetical protein